MGAGASKHGNVKRKVQAVSAFEDAGKRHREKRGKTHEGEHEKKPDKKGIQQMEINNKLSGENIEISSRWAKLRERTLSKEERETRKTLRLSDFNKVVRKRTLEPEDENPIDIPYETNNKVEQEELCDICSVYTGRETYPCRICSKVYHEGCLRKLGQCCDPASSLLLKRALKPMGWSCHNCDNLSNLLTEEEIVNLMMSFDKYEVAQDSSITLDDYMDYRKRLHKDTENTEMSIDDQQAITMTFHRIDKHGAGSITWWEFLNYESARLLQERSKNAIIRLLSTREIDLARRLFRVFDHEMKGEITEHDARKAIASWYTLFLESDDTLNGFALMSSNKNDELTFVLVETLTFTMDTNKNQNRVITWNEYIRELSIYVLAARPNLSPVPVEGSKWTKSVVVSTEKDCNIKQTSL